MAIPMVLLTLTGLLFVVPVALSENYAHCGHNKYGDDVGKGATAYIVGGKTARPQEFPWTVSIRWKGRTDMYAHTCMGALIHESWVISAAHCFYGTPLDQYEVVLGQNSIYDTDESNPARQRFDVEDWFWYDDTAKHAYYEGDIALVKIKGHAEFNENVRTICLAHPTYDYAGEEAVVAGWGSQTQGVGDYSEQLKYFTGPILSNEVCKTDGGYEEGITENMICAGETHEMENAPCGGDNGAPMVVYRGMWELVGVYGWSYGCAKGYPTVYVRINKYHDWMKMIMDSYPDIPNYP